MTSPDLNELVDLTLYDVSPTDLVERAVLDATVKMPTWLPLEGNTEMVLMEAMALETAELVFAINRLPAGIVEALLRLFGVTRSAGLPATATATFAVGTTAGLTLPAGTVVALPLGDGTALTFTTNIAVLAAPGATSVNAAITAQTSTAAGNGVAVGTALTLVSSVPYIDSVVLATSPTGGLEPETTTSWLTRGSQTLGRLVETLVLPKHFTAEALGTPGVFRALTVDNWNVTASAAGHVTVAVLAAGGVALSSGAKASLLATLESKALANLVVHVVDPTITNVNVTAQVHAKAGYSSATVIANVTAALGAYLNPDTWEWSATVRYNELITVIDAAEGVDYVISLTAPAADVALTGVAPLAKLGTSTITVA